VLLRLRDLSLDVSSGSLHSYSEAMYLVSYNKTAKFILDSWRKVLIYSNSVISTSLEYVFFQVIVRLPKAPCNVIVFGTTATA